MNRIYSKYYNDMYAAAYEILHDSQLAEDAVQESAIRLMRNLHKLDEDCPYKVRAFAVIVCENAAKSIARARRDDLPLDENLPSPLPGPEDAAVTKENVERAAKLIYSMNSIYRDVIILHCVNELSTAETADVLGISVEAARKRLSRAKNMLKKMLEEEEYNE